MLDIFLRPLMLTTTSLERLDFQLTCLSNAFKMGGNQILKLIIVFGFIFHNVICYIRSMSTNEATYVMVAFECGNDC
jgi:hypothetical protein